MIDVPYLQKGLKTKAFGRKVYAFDTIDSTNSCARTMAGAWAAEGTIVVAEHQTAGRGRLGRSWVDSSGSSLTFSVVLRPRLSPDAINLLPLLVGVAVAEGIHAATGLRPECKWPNDILIGGRKVCGILCEGAVRDQGLDFVIAGIGINVNQTSFPPEIAGVATSLAIASGKEVKREDLLRAILRQLESLYHGERSTEFAGVPTLWEPLTRMLGTPVTLTTPEAVLNGTAIRIARDGGLVLTVDGTERTVYAGDVTLRPPNGSPHAPGN